MQLIFSIVIWLILGFYTSYVAQQKGRDPVGWFVGGLVLGIFGLLLVFLLPPVNSKESMSSENEIQISPLSVKDLTHQSEHLPSEYENLQWFYLALSREQVGPLTFVELEDAYREGTINKDSFVWCEGMPEWYRLEELKIF